MRLPKGLLVEKPFAKHSEDIVTKTDEFLEDRDLRIDFQLLSSLARLQEAFLSGLLYGRDEVLIILLIQRLVHGLDVGMPDDLTASDPLFPSFPSSRPQICSSLVLRGPLVRIRSPHFE